MRPCLSSVSFCLFREMALFDMAAASSVQVVMIIEPLIQYSSDLFPEGKMGSLLSLHICSESQMCE